MGTIGASSYYSDSYDYADYPEAPAAPAGGSQDLGDPSTVDLDGDDLYTEVFDDSYYVEDGTAGTGQRPQVGSMDAEEAGALAEPTPEMEESKQLRNQIDELKKQVESSAFPSASKQELSSQLDRAISGLDISPESIEAASEIYQSVQENYARLSQFSPAAIELAAQLSKDVEVVEAAAKEAGLDLAHLPQPPNSAVMTFLNSLGIPGDQRVEEYKILREQRRQNMSALKSSLNAQYQAYSTNKELAPNAGDVQMSEAYKSFQDSEYLRMQAVVTELRAPIVAGLQAMGYNATAGAAPDQIAVGGVTLDYFNEDVGSLGLSSQLTSLTQTQAEFATETEPPEETDWVEVGLMAGGAIIGGVTGSIVGGIVGGVVFSPVTTLVGGAAGAIGGAALGKWVDDTFFDW